jgi:succinate dehydrogenase / fumarate reductase cytochrome b subunit
MSARQVIRNVSVVDLVRYRLPVSAVLSILHRISGALMFVLLPFVLWMLQLSLRSEAGFEQLRLAASGWCSRIVLAALAWALLHHLAAGIRYLLIDLDVGVDRESARRSAWIVFAVSLPPAAWIALMIFGVL